MSISQCSIIPDVIDVGAMGVIFALISDTYPGVPYRSGTSVISHSSGSSRNVVSSSSVSQTISLICASSGAHVSPCLVFLSTEGRDFPDSL